MTKALEKIKHLGDVVKVAPLYESLPYGIRDQGLFLNSAVLLHTDNSPLNLLEGLKRIEKNLGRKERLKWGPREIDIDIIFYGSKIVQEGSFEYSPPGLCKPPLCAAAARGHCPCVCRSGRHYLHKAVAAALSGSFTSEKACSNLGK